jgi:signal transduction histidine kinase
MRRFWHIWLWFAACLAVVLAGMAWVSAQALRLDRAESDARRQAALEENVRLALWRMDSALAPLVAQESARPYFAFRTFLPLDRAYVEMFNRLASPAAVGETLAPSPLLQPVSPYILIHFQFLPDGRLASPQVPEGSEYALAVPQHLAAEGFSRATAQLSRVARTVDRRRLLAALPAPDQSPLELIAPLPEPFLEPQQALSQQAEATPQGKGALEYLRRDRAVQQNTKLLVQSQVANAAQLPIVPDIEPTDLSGVLMTPLWAGGELLLARRVRAGGQEYVQGCLLDWPAIRAWLVAAVADLLPAADLEPLRAAADDAGDARRLAALPVRLVPGSLPVDGNGRVSAVELSVAVAWLCVLIAAAAVAMLLWGVIRLSERRATFVSAVTHELRTPLTTFHMYTEMLAEGMVPEPARRQEYLETLRREATRLTHLVENVLAYARLERGRAAGRVESFALGPLLEQIVPRLVEHARHAGMEIASDFDAGALAAAVRANPSAVEQIVFNLVDNACKYAGAAADRRIHLAARCQGAWVALRVSDHGPGIAPSALKRLFRPFSKSAREAAHSAPGVGLGLALSRRLARDMGAELALDRHAGGASFVLSLPLDL